MNIYKVTRKDYHDKGEDYESFVCVAETEEDAKMLHPDDFHMEIDERGYLKESYTASWQGQIKRSFAMGKWVSKPENVIVEFIGEVKNNNYELAQVILASKEQQ